MSNDFFEECLHFEDATSTIFDFDSINEEAQITEVSVMDSPTEYSYDITMEIILATHLSRTQWYPLQCKFSANGRPAFVGRAVIIDPSVAFLDSRKRVNIDRGAGNPPLSISLFGSCSVTGKALQKCQKCKIQDKATTNRKRKRDTDDGWTAIDQDNNSKLFQLLETGNLVVGSDGILNLRFRALCCVGATRQFHRNHVSSSVTLPGLDNDDEIHKGCEGFTLVVVVKNNPGQFYQSFMKQPVRVVGKVTKNGTSTGAPVMNHFDHFKVNQAPPCTPKNQHDNNFIFTEKDRSIQIVPCCSMNIPEGNFSVVDNHLYQSPRGLSAQKNLGIRGNLGVSLVLPEYSQKPNSGKENGWHIYQLFSVLRKNLNDGSSLRKLALIYQIRTDGLFDLSYRAVFEPGFFDVSNLLQIPLESPAMLHVYTVLGIGYTAKKKNGKKKESLFLLAEELAFQLLQLPIKDLPEEQLFYLADGISRVGILQALAGKITNSRYLFGESLKMFETLVSFQPEIIVGKQYELLVWGMVSFNPEVTILQNAYEFFRSLDRPRLMIRIITNLIISTCFTNLPLGKSAAPNRPNPPLLLSQRQSLLSLCDLLEDTFQKARFSEDSYMKTRSRAIENCDPIFTSSYGKVIESALRALRHWICWDIKAAKAEIKNCTIQATISTTPHQDSSPLNIASFVAVQLAGLQLYPTTTGTTSTTSLQHYPTTPATVATATTPTAATATTTTTATATVMPTVTSAGLETRFHSNGNSPNWSEKLIRSMNFAEIMIKFSRMNAMPWGKFLDEFNQAIFQNFVNAML